MKQFKFSTLSAFRIAMMLALAGVASVGYAQTITTFDVANSTDTFAVAINPAGQVTGDYDTADHTGHGFLRETDGTIVTFDVPGAAIGSSLGTWPRAINPTGQIAGYYDDTTTQSAGCNGHCLTRHAFLRQRNGTFITFDVPGAGSGNGQGTFPESINPSGEIAGEYIDVNGNLHGFLRQPDGTIITFDPNGSTLTSPSGINSAGEITGFYSEESRPGELHPEPLAEPDVNLSIHPAPIKQTYRSYRGSSGQTKPFAPGRVVAKTGSPGPYGL